MGKPKKSTQNKSPNRSKFGGRYESVLGSDEDVNDVSDNDPNELNDEIDSFHDNHDKQLLNRSSFNKNVHFDFDDDQSDSNEEIMPIDSEDDSSDDQNNDRLNRFEVEFQKDEMASDLEDEDSDLPDVNAWGKKKNVFYNTDYVDTDFRSNNNCFIRIISS